MQLTVNKRTSILCKISSQVNSMDWMVIISHINMDHGSHKLIWELNMNIYLTIMRLNYVWFKELKTKEQNKNYFKYNLIACFHHLEILLCRSMTEPCGKVMVLFSTTIAACYHQHWSSALRYALACSLLHLSLVAWLYTANIPLRKCVCIQPCLHLSQNLLWWRYGQPLNIKWAWDAASVLQGLQQYVAGTTHHM